MGAPVSRVRAAMRAVRRGSPTGDAVQAPAAEPEPPAPHVVSVIVPVYQAQDYLDECLDSLRTQSYPQLQIIVVDDGSTDGSGRICARHAASDPRIQVLRQHNAGLGAARNAGIAQATGEYLTFLDADDTLPPGAYEVLVRSLDGSGSDFALGSVQRVTHGVHRTPAWIREVHERDRTGIRIDDLPRAVLDVIACNRMVRRSFWHGAGLSFPEGVAYEDHVPMMTAYVRASSFDILAATTYYWRIREDLTSIGQQKHQVANLRDRLAAKRAAWQVLAAEASGHVQAAWRTRVLDMDLPLFIDQVPQTGEDYFAVLRDGVRENLAGADEQVLAEVRVERRIKAYLVAAGRRTELVALLERERDGLVGPTTLLAGRLVADYPELADLPVELRQLGERQSALRVTLRRFWWSAPGTLELDLSAYVPYLDLRAVTSSAQVWWVAGDGTRIELAARAYSDPEITRDAQPSAHCYDSSGLRLTVPVADLIARAADGTSAAAPTQRWYLLVEVEAGGLIRRGVVRHRDTRGSAGRFVPSGLAGGWRLRAHLTRDLGLTLEAIRSFATLAGITRDGGRLELSVRATPATAFDRLSALVIDTAPSAGSEPGVVWEDVEVRDGIASARLLVPRLQAPVPGDRWILRAHGAGVRTVLAWPAEDPRYSGGWAAVPVDGASHADCAAPGPAVVVRRTPSSGVRLEVVTETLEVLDVRAQGAGVVVAGRWLGAEPSGAVATLVSANGRIELTARTVAAGELVQWEAATTVGLGPDGQLAQWELTVTAALGPVTVLTGPDLLARLPQRWAGVAARRLLVRTPADGLAVLVEPLQWAPA